MVELFHWNISITGRVQGVFFRASTQEMAEQLNIKGFIRNEADSSVYVEAEGSVEQLANFKAWCEQGPERAEVRAVAVNEGELTNFKDFKIY